MSLELGLDMILGMTPVPGLSAAFSLLKLIVSSVQQAGESNRQLEVLATSVAHLLETLNAEFSASRLAQSACTKPMQDLYSLLNDIQSFVREEQERSFFKSLFTSDSRTSEIDSFYRRISALANAFQISALLNIQRMLSNDETARRRDGESVNARLSAMEQNQLQLWRVVDANQTSTSFLQPQMHGTAPFNSACALQYQTVTGGVPVLQNGNAIDPWTFNRPTSCPHCSRPCATPALGSPMPSNCPSCGNWVQDRCGGNSAPAPSQPRPRILFHPRKTDPYYGFTNVSPHPVKYGGKEYPTSAHLFQAFKYMDNHPDIAERIRITSKSPLKARALSVAYEAQEHPDWVRMRVAKMEIALWHKFSQNTELKTLLLGTGDADIVNYTNQKFWGVGKTLEGSNELGKALERVRKSLRGT